jgi:pyrroloquinoline quinone biosynthesis protein B
MKSLLLALFLSFTVSSLFAQSFELQILGITQDAGYPQAGCDMECCENAKHEYVSSAAIHEGNKFWIIDATPDFTAQLALAQSSFPESELAGIFLTHAHIGHYTGLMYLGREAMNTKNLPVYCLPRMADFLRTNGPWKQLVELENIKIIELQANTGTSLGSYVSITAIEVPHRDEYSETAAFLVASKKKKALYLPDIDKWEKWNMTLEGYLSIVDIALVDGTFFNADELPNRNIKEVPHPLVSETMVRLKDEKPANKSKIYFTHFNHTNPLLKESTEKALVEKEGFKIAKTGMLL